ncbi:hypothetical protein CYMTET_34431 [Cymbomonas tetramitiformis]|uniref:VWFA domain-containing protein n=1 Tax=Cymbomonas tetramitiformis TaxID=36881 RepID=A0AAE0KQ71_9CHLO|nr:hypothetical protein CYMTET_34431 [Cymbomonas tetramitiformis]
MHPFRCEGIYSTDTCELGYTCDHTNYQCVKAAPGEGERKEDCDKHCKAPAPVFTCDNTTDKCLPCPPDPRPPGTICASKEVCEETCGKAPPGPQPSVYKCNMSSFTCDAVAPGTPGAASEEVCEKSCFNPHDPCMVYPTCETCLEHTATGCGWCSSNVKYQNLSAGGSLIGGHCAGVAPGTAKFVCAGTYSTDTCGAHGNCSANVDIVYAVDASCSINKNKDWPIEKSIVDQFAKSFTFGAGGASGEFARQGIVYFSKDVVTATGLTGSEADFVTALAGMQYGVGGCQTHTGEAMKEVYDEFVKNPRPKTDARIALLLTDGAAAPSSQQAPAVAYANKIKALGGKVYAIAVGKYAKYVDKIDAIASTPSSTYVYTSATWQDARDLAKKIVASICGHNTTSLIAVQ